MGGAGPVPFVVVDRYADRYEVDDFDEFLQMIRAMDAAFLKYQAERAPKAKS